MEREFLQLSVWDQFNAREAQAVARALACCLPAPWAFEGVEAHACGDQRRQVAFYRLGEARFALVPGGEIDLGYDHSRPLSAQLQERDDWLEQCPEIPDPDEEDEQEEWVSEYFRWSDFFAWKARLPGPRKVRLEPFLIETEARWVKDFLPGVTFTQLVENLADQGLRLPTSDEWEHACAAGSRTLWRWGDFCPDHSPEEDGPDLIHRLPNAFGLRYRGYSGGEEVVAEPGVRRNGDGGVALCGGHGFPCAWLALASAFVWVWPEKEGPLTPYRGVRRACSLPEGCLD